MHLLKNKLGFSLIELMMVVAIISILALAGIPSYRNYALRARFTEVINAAQLFKTAVAVALFEGADLSDLTTGANGIPNAPEATKNLASIEIDNGTIVATGSALVNHATYILKPNADGSTWSISGSCLENGLCRA